MRRCGVGVHAIYKHACVRREVGDARRLGMAALANDELVAKSRDLTSPESPAPGERPEGGRGWGGTERVAMYGYLWLSEDTRVCVGGGWGHGLECRDWVLGWLQ